MAGGGASADAQEARSVEVEGHPTAARSREARRRPATKRYWLDYERRVLRRSDRDGAAPEDVVQDLHGPYGIGYDPVARHVFWTSSDDEVVQAVGLRSRRPVSLPTSFEQPFFVARTEGDRDVVYAVLDGSVQKLTRLTGGGGETQEVLRHLGPQPVHGIALSPDGNGLYLGDEIGRMTRRVDVRTGRLERLLFVEKAHHHAAAECRR
jgi:hypothetical protein